MSDNGQQDLGRVAVLYGGLSAEREVSLQSGAAVLRGLRNRGIDAYGIDVGRDLMARLIHERPQRVFIALHGRGGEDGQIQGALEWLGIPYTGSGVLGSAIGMDKARCKQLWQAVGLPTPKARLISERPENADLLEGLRFPMAVKPATEGSSIGVSRAEDFTQLQQAWDKAAQFDPHVLVEEWIEGDEYTAALLGEQVLPLIRLQSPHDFYDYEAKYVSDATQYLCPCGLDPERETELGRLMAEAFACVDARGWGRVDFMLDGQGQPWLLEVNTVPGMTSHSLVPMAAQAAGIDFDELVERILRDARLSGGA